jgi:hypothetical protein
MPGINRHVERLFDPTRKVTRPTDASADAANQPPRHRRTDVQFRADNSRLYGFVFRCSLGGPKRRPQPHMDDTELVGQVVSLLDRISRAERFAAATSSQEERDRFLAMVAELQHELDVIRDQPAALLRA